jgi:AmmeMemoRadiSam system protein A
MTTTERKGRHPAHSPVPSKPVIPVTEQRTLLEIARSALRVATGITSPLALTASVSRGQPLGLRAAVFVTLTEAGELRGCMGTLEPDRPIEESVALTAITAALQDPRFRPVAADELELIHVDVSILGPSVELEDPSAFVPGVHGVMVECAGRRALLLPEVATDHGWGGGRMLDAVCQKAGLPHDVWRDPKTKRLYFRTVRFGGSAVEGADVSA